MTAGLELSKGSAVVIMDADGLVELGRATATHDTLGSSQPSVSNAQFARYWNSPRR